MSPWHRDQVFGDRYLDVRVAKPVAWASDGVVDLLGGHGVPSYSNWVIGQVVRPRVGRFSLLCRLP